MTKHFKKYYPVAGKKSPYVILENADECSAMLSEDGVRYSDSDIVKLKSFSRLAKYIILAWCFAALFLILQQTFYHEIYVVDRQTSSFFHSVHYMFSGDNTIRNNAAGDVKCTPGVPFKPDSCNTCQCDSTGKIVACTKMLCGNQQGPLHL